VRIETPDAFYDSWSQSLPGDPDGKLAAFTDQLTRTATIAFEPNMRINAFFKAVTSCSDTGHVFLRRGHSGGCTEAFRTAHARNLEQLQHEALQDWSGFRADTAHYFESALTTAADLLVQTGATQEATALFESVCAQKNSLCGTTSLNNLAAYYLDAQRYEDAARVLFELESRLSSVPAAVRQNLNLAVQHLDAATIAALRSRAP
jgi:hypothetical protein